MTLLEALHVAQTESELHGCTQHVIFKATAPLDDTTARGYYYVSDWYNDDSVIKSFTNGNEQY